LLAISLAFYVMFSFMFTQMLHFQLVRGHEALAAAVRFLPLPFGLMPAAANSDRLVAKFGRHRVVSMGLVLVTLGMVLFSTQVDIGTNYWVIAGVFFILGLGMGLTMAPSTSLVMEAIPADKAGVGSATNDASREIGGALGIAIGGSVLNELYRREFVLPAGLDASSLPADPSTSFPAAIRIGEQLREMGSPAGQALIDMGREAFMTGMTSSAGVSALISITAAIVVYRWMPRTNNLEAKDGESE
jgi:MFS family permease